MRDTCGLVSRVALAACVACTGCTTLATVARTIAAGSSTWYWQNPLPRVYSLSAIDCRSVTQCVAVGAGGFDVTTNDRGGLILTTNDGGQHWSVRPSGTSTGLQVVTCPGTAICYALGSEVAGSAPDGQAAGITNVILRSANGGRTWRQSAAHIPAGPGQSLWGLACPSPRICLAAGGTYTTGATALLLRTTDSGRTWHTVSLPGLTGFDPGPIGFNAVTCPTKNVCYVVGYSGGRSRLARSDDAGRTWTLRGLHVPRFPTGLACPAANTCFATAKDCLTIECYASDVFVTRDGARNWKLVKSGSTGGIACPGTATCYALADRSVLRTTNSGKTWTVRRLPDQAGAMTCSSPTTCYAITVFGMLKTSDGFGHTRETLAHSAIHGQALMNISCPSTTTCYASGSRNVCPEGNSCGDVPASFAATSDGGKTWRMTSKTPDLLERLSCPGDDVCFAIDASDQGPIAVDRSDDGTQTWQQIKWQQISSQIVANGQASDITCVGGTTCYLLATIPENQRLLLAVLVTHDSGYTWSVQSAIDAAARAGSTDPSTNIRPSRISCPSISTCFVLAALVTSSPGSLEEQVVLLSTTDGGQTWTRHLTVPGTVLASGYPPFGQELSCPTTTTCYLLSFMKNPDGGPNGLPGPVLITHDAGATWQSSVVSTDEFLWSISCAAAQNCRVVGSSGIFATDDGGMTWQRDSLAGGSQFPLMMGIACPAVDTCYSVGRPDGCCGVSILATHPPGALHALVEGEAHAGWALCPGSGAGKGWSHLHHWRCQFVP